MQVLRDWHLSQKSHLDGWSTSMFMCQALAIYGCPSISVNISQILGELHSHLSKKKKAFRIIAFFWSTVEGIDYSYRPEYIT